MQTIQVQSQAIKSIAWDQRLGVLSIEFSSGIYKYYGVPQTVVDEFFLAESKGKYFNKNIKNQYTTVIQ